MTLHSAFSPFKMASAAINSARAVSRSSNSRADAANLLCFFAALICLKGKAFGGIRGDEDGGEIVLFGGDDEGVLGRPSVEVEATSVEDVGEESAEALGKRGTNGLIGGL